MPSVNSIALIGKVINQPKIEHTQYNRYLSIELLTQDVWRIGTEHKAINEVHKLRLYGALVDRYSTELEANDIIYVDGSINWDIAILVGGFGLTLLVSQALSGKGMPANPQQSTANKITPLMITGMFLFFPLPAGVLLYMVIANIFQALQTFLLSKEDLPANLQKILDDQLAQQTKTATVTASPLESERLPFEPKSGK